MGSTTLLLDKEDKRNITSRKSYDETLGMGLNLLGIKKRKRDCCCLPHLVYLIIPRYLNNMTNFIGPVFSVASAYSMT